MVEEKLRDGIDESVRRIREKVFESRISSTHYLLHHISALLNGSLSLFSGLPEIEIKCLFTYLHQKYNEKLKGIHGFTQAACDMLFSLILSESNRIKTKCRIKTSPPRNPVILVLDSKLNNFPFENLPLFRDLLQPICRMPTMDHLVFACERFNGGKVVDPYNAFFVLNPTKDLISTQKVFEKMFTEKMHWKGLIGKEPKEQEVFKALEESELFVYCGHGAGEGFYSSEDLRKIEVRSSALLMGCSSSFFSDNGVYENNGVLMAYLTSGSPLIVGNLWDVTDKDIDRYLKTLLDLWLPEKNTLAGRQEGKTSNLLEAAIRARSTCKMGYLIGAAPVCYGLPIYSKVN